MTTAKYFTDSEKLDDSEINSIIYNTMYKHRDLMIISPFYRILSNEILSFISKGKISTYAGYDITILMSDVQHIIHGEYELFIIGDMHNIWLCSSEEVLKKNIEH